MAQSRMLISTLFVIALVWKLLKCPWTTEGLGNLWCIHSMEFHRFEKEGRQPYMKETHKHNAEWKKLDVKEHLLYDSINIKFSNIICVVWSQDKQYLGWWVAPRRHEALLVARTVLFLVLFWALAHVRADFVKIRWVVHFSVSMPYFKKKCTLELSFFISSFFNSSKNF